MLETDHRLDELRRIFAGELDERLTALNQWMLRLERGTDSGTWNETFDALLREAHSLKGAARAVGAEPVEQLAHALEASLQAAHDRGSPATGSWFDAVYRALDLLVPLARGPEDTPLADLTAVLAELHSETPPPAAPGPAPARFEEDHAGGEVPAPVERDLTGGSPPATVTTAPISSPAVAGPRTDPDSVRVAVSKLDGLLGQAGELAVTRIRIEQRLAEMRDVSRSLEAWRRELRTAQALRVSLAQRLSDADAEGQELTRDVSALLRLSEAAEQRALRVSERVGEVGVSLGRDTAQLGIVSRAIEDGVMAARLIPLSTLAGPLERLVRDVSHASGKQVELVFSGGEIEIDRRVLEQLRDPLMHMLRNAVDHGIEAPEQRRAAGKPETGRIEIAGFQRGDIVEINIRDDGAGLDPVALKNTAVRRGLMDEVRAEGLDEEAAFDLIFLPGFSTSQTVTEISGRGVGLDVVRDHVERLDGRVRVRSLRGMGTEFSITVPLTVATTRALLAQVGSQLLAIPAGGVERNGRVRRSDLRSIEGRSMIDIDGHPVPVLDLTTLLDLPAVGSPQNPGDWLPFFVLAERGRRVAVGVERLVGEQEVVVKHLAWPLVRVRNVAGAATLGSGKTIVILNTGDLLRTATGLLETGRATPTSAAHDGATAKPVPRLLIVEDSITTRTLMRSILEAAGFNVSVAADGMDALTVLRASEVDLVVSDIEMPRLDGFGLTAEIRRDERLKNTPVVLVTSLEKPEHKERGVAVGADAYIVKSGFDQQQLLDTVGRLLS